MTGTSTILISNTLKKKVCASQEIKAYSPNGWKYFENNLWSMDVGEKFSTICIENQDTSLLIFIEQDLRL